MVKVYEVGELYFDGKAPVPSYEEWQESQKKRALWFEEKAKTRNKLEAKIKLLEEQLQEANEVIKVFRKKIGVMVESLLVFQVLILAHNHI